MTAALHRARLAPLRPVALADPVIRHAPALAPRCRSRPRGETALPHGRAQAARSVFAHYPDMPVSVIAQGRGIRSIHGYTIVNHRRGVKWPTGM